MSSNDLLVDSATRHQIYIQRFAGGQVKQLLPLLKNMVADIQRELNAAQTLRQAQRLSFRLQEVQDIIDDAMVRMESGLTSNLDEFVDYEAEFAVKALNAASKAKAVLPESPILRAIVTDSSMTLLAGQTEQSLTLKQAFRQFSVKKKDDARRIIQNGFAQGKTGQEMAREVQALGAKRFRRQAESLIRTATNHMASEARAATHAANSDILDGEEWVSVLDGRTTITCASLDGKIFPIGQGPVVPRHWQCRSNRVPVLKPEYSILGKTGTRASMHGQVSAKRTYSGWLRDQPAAFQDEVLGRERAKLFRAGGLSLDKFTDDTGKVYSLDMLRQLEPQAFEQVAA